MAENINKLQIPTTDTESFDIAFEYIPEQSLLYNEETQTLYQKSNGEAIAIGSLVSYTKGINALHFEGEIEEEITEYPESDAYTNGAVVHIVESSVVYEGTDKEEKLASDSFIINIGTLEEPSWHQIGKGGGAGGDEIECETLTVKSKNKTAPVWKTNLYLGNTGKNGNYIIFNEYSATAQRYSSGHFLVKGNANVYLWDLLVNVSNGGLQNMVNNGDAPVDLYKVTYKNKDYYALHINEASAYDVYYTGWISEDFKVFSYEQSELSNFSKLALGELDLDNIPTLEGVPEPRFAWSDGGETIVNYYNHWDFDESPICYIRITGGNAASKNFQNFCNNTYRNTNENAIDTVCRNPLKPVYLILDQCTNMNNVMYGQGYTGLWNFTGNGTRFSGLYGLILPQDNQSANGPSAWANRFCSDLPNLESLKLNRYTDNINSGNLLGLPKLMSITMPESLSRLNTDGASAPLMDSTNIKAIYFPNLNDVVQMNGYTTITEQWYWIDGFNFFVPGSMIQAYKENYASIGYLSGLFKTY